jgi:hypothetical protein
MFLSNEEDITDEKRMWKLSTSRKLWCVLHQFLKHIPLNQIEPLPTAGPLLDHPAYSASEVEKLLAECVMNQSYEEAENAAGQSRRPIIWKSYRARQSDGPLSPVGVNIDVNRPEGAAPAAAAVVLPATRLHSAQNTPLLIRRHDQFSSVLFKSGSYYMMNLLICRVAIKRLVTDYLMLNKVGRPPNGISEISLMGMEQICPGYTLAFMYDTFEAYINAVKLFSRSYHPHHIWNHVHTVEELALMLKGGGVMREHGLGTFAKIIWGHAFSAYDVETIFALKAAVYWEPPIAAPAFEAEVELAERQVAVAAYDAEVRAAKVAHVPVALAAIQSCKDMLIETPMTVHNSLPRDELQVSAMNEALVEGNEWSSTQYMRLAMINVEADGIFSELFVEAAVNAKKIHCANRINHVTAAFPQVGDPIFSEDNVAVQVANSKEFAKRVFGNHIYRPFRDLKEGVEVKVKTGIRKVNG